MASLISGASLPVHSAGATGAPGGPRAPVTVSSAPHVVPLAAPPPASVTLAPHLAQPGATLLASGTVPFAGQPYCLCLVPNGTFAASDTPTPTPTDTLTPTPTDTPTATATSTPTATPTLAPGGPDVTVTASCTLGAAGSFVITNSGGAMLTAGSWTLTLDGTPIATNTFQLAAGGSTTVNTSGLFGVLVLTASGGGIPTPVTGSATCPTPTPTPTDTPVAAPAAAPLAATVTPPPPRRHVWQSPPSRRAGTLATGISCVASAEITPTDTTFSNVALVAPAAGSYDLLLLDGPCGSSTATILAMDAPGDAAGLVVSPPIPAGGRGGLLLFVVALAVAGWFLVRTSRG